VEFVETRNDSWGAPLSEEGGGVKSVVGEVPLFLIKNGQSVGNHKKKKLAMAVTDKKGSGKSCGGKS